MLIQFLAAFDNVVISRFNDRERVTGQNIQVKYVYAPKQRVLYDLINPGQNLVLPVVAVNITSIARDENRVFSKNSGFLAPSMASKNTILPVSPYYKTPVPVNISISMSVLTKNQIDMDQIISNFVPYNNPYIIIAWKVPEIFNPVYEQEIRTEVLWDGNISLNYPLEINNTQKAQVIADTSFTIKGWLFPYVDRPVKNIYKIDTSFYAIKKGTNIDYTNYFDLSALGLSVQEDREVFYSNTTTVSGYPKFTDINIIKYYNTEVDL